MSKKTAIVGAGGLGRETFDLIRSVDPQGKQWMIAGFIDIDADERLLNAMGTPWLGTDDDFLKTQDSDSVFLAVGDPCLRSQLAERYQAAGVQLETFIHPNAVIGSLTFIGMGCILSAGAMVMNSCQLDSCVVVDRGTMIGHDSQIGNFVTLHPGSIVSGGVVIGDLSRLGTRSCVLPNLEVGSSVTIGAGAVVVSDIPAGVTVAGVPARHLRHE